VKSRPDAPAGRQLFDLRLPADNPPVDAAEAGGAIVIFVRDHDALDRHSALAVGAARRDVLTWIAYPKGGQLGTDLNRDSLNSVLKARGVQGVRQISIDATWSALRFRPASR
jgi:hypothetical protein